MLASFPFGIGICSQYYSILDLGVIGNDSVSAAFAINNYGQAVGFSDERGFIYTDGAIRSLYPNGNVRRPYGINDKGEVVGNGQNAFLYSHGILNDLGPLDGIRTGATAINNSGQIVGYAGNRAFLYSNGLMNEINLNLDGTTGGTPYAINNHGEVVGLGIGQNHAGHAILRHADGSLFDIDNLLNPLHDPQSGSRAYGINDLGQVVGYNGNSHAFLYANEAVLDLGTLGGGASEATGINIHGQIVGNSYTSNMRIHAFLYSDGVLYDLNTMIDPSLGWELLHAEAINNSGQIAGYGYNGNGQMRAFIISTIPEPACLTLAGACLLIFMKRSR